jgi:long-chain acyl-CoA synthetase
MTIYSERPWLSLYDEGLPSDIHPDDASALEMFRRAAERRPDAPAVLYFDRAISFAEVDRLSDGLAAGLRAEGLQAGDRVAICLQNVPQYLISVLAIWKAGGIGVSINPMNREKEVATILDDSGARAIVVLESLWHDVVASVGPATAVATVITTSELDFLERAPSLLRDSRRRRPEGTLDLLELVEAHRDDPAPAHAPTGDDVAFLTYTSGTTGPPKGAMNTHANVVFNASVYQRWASLDHDDVILGVAPLFHITGLVAHLALGMRTGAPVVLAYRFDADTLLELIERHRATFCIGAIPVYMALMASPTLPDRDVTSFRKLSSGGAPIAPPLVDEFAAKFHGTYLHNNYGMTETTSPSHWVPAGRTAPVDPVSGALSVGVPVFNTVVRVVDEHGQDVPVGEVGEFVTKGPQVVPGYWQKPEETANAIRDGWIHTGDVGKMDADGWFYVVDRKKDQINASGYKVWPREVEDVLYTHPAVREAAVVGVPDPYRGETVKAFVALRPGTSIDEAGLIAHCKQRMAAYKYPRQIEFVDELPKTATGKVLRRQLRDADGAAAR